MSLGSILVRNLAEMAPERVQSLILGGAITRLNLRSRFLVGVGNLFKRVMPYLWLYSLFAWIIMPRKTHREARSIFIQEARKLCQKEFLRWFKLTWRINPLLRFFEEKETPMPVLYVMGEEDHMFLPAVRRIIEKQKNCFLKVVEGAGHVCNIDRPHLFNRYVINFLQSQAVAAA
jgi:pimeloyl-ACP methyl ester carboxylesterase